MWLTFMYTPTRDLAASAQFYRDVLGLTEAWRDGDETIAFGLPDGAAQVMVSLTPQPAGPMYQVDDVSTWLGDHGQARIVVEQFDIPGGIVAGLADPAGNVFYVFDQTDDPS